MTSVERMPLSRLPAAERDEIEALLRTPNDPRCLSDFADTAAWWILAGVAATAGAVALVYELAHGGLDDLQFFPGALASGDLWMAVRSAELALGLAALLGVLAWIAVAWVQNRGRRGYLATSFATVRIKGRRVVLMRHARVADVETERHGRRGSRFTVLKLIGDDGRRLTLYVTGTWTEAALARLREARA